MREMHLLIRQGCSAEGCGRTLEHEFHWARPIPESLGQFEESMVKRGWQKLDRGGAGEDYAHCPDHAEEM